MSNDEHDRNNRPLDLPMHGRPVTRRDFLGRGLLSGAAAVTMPSILGMLGAPGRALAAPGDCGLVVGGAQKIPYIGFDLAGGASVAGSNVLTGGPGGQIDWLSLDAYKKLGLPESMAPPGILPPGGLGDPDQVASDLGLMFHIDSAFYRGIKTKIKDTTAERINGCVICARSANDTNANPHNPIYGINAAGAGGLLVQLIGTSGSTSGGRSVSPMSMIDPSKRPTQVARARDARGLVDTGRLVELLNSGEAGQVMLASQMITELKLARMIEAEETKQIIRCAFEETTDLVTNFGNPNALDPTMDEFIITGDDPILSLDELDDSSFEKTATVMKLVMNRNAGAGTIELGGYDYHDGTRATGEVRDFKAGQCMGAALEYAARLDVPLMLYVFSDGSLASNGQIDTSAEGRDKGRWQGDNSGTASVFMLAFNPNGRPALASAATNNQLGAFKMDGNVDTSAIRTADAVDLLAEMIVLNYMALNGDVGAFQGLFPGNGLGSTVADLTPFIAFEALS